MPTSETASFGTVESLLLDELRRSRETNEKVLNGLSELNTQLALMQQAHGQDRDGFLALKVQVTDLEKRVDALQSWRDRQSGERGALGGLLNSPILGWIVAAAAFVYTKVTAN